MNLSSGQLIAIIVLIAVVIVGIALLLIEMRRRRSILLRSRFGEAEYDRAMAERGDRRRAEAELADRAARVKSYRLRALSADERLRFTDLWAQIQARFVDAPAGAVADADRLLSDVMVARGYPVEDFERRASDISVTHPSLTRNYRSAHEIALRQANGQATTEDLRHAVIHYRALFEELLAESSSEKMPPASERPVEYGTRPSLRAR